jgi:hypothetical protein
MAYDPLHDVVILFGGFGADGWERDDTWQFNCTSREWMELEPTTNPLARYGHVMVYDESVNLIVLCCGNTAYQGHQDDTWTFNLTANTWSEVSTIGNPDPLKWPSMVYDSVNQRCILFGGQIGDNAVNGTWIYNAQICSWTDPEPADAPASRILAAMSFDSKNSVTLLYGGQTVGSTKFNDTWVYYYENNTWIDISEREPRNLTSTTLTTQTTTTSSSSIVTSLTPTITTTTSTTTTSLQTSDITLILVAIPIVILTLGVIVYLIKRGS